LDTRPRLYDEDVFKKLEIDSYESDYKSLAAEALSKTFRITNWLNKIIEFGGVSKVNKNENCFRTLVNDLYFIVFSTVYIYPHVSGKSQYASEKDSVVGNMGESSRYSEEELLKMIGEDVFAIANELRQFKGTGSRINISATKSLYKHISTLDKKIKEHNMYFEDKTKVEEEVNEDPLNDDMLRG